MKKLLPSLLPLLFGLFSLLILTSCEDKRTVVSPSSKYPTASPTVSTPAALVTPLQKSNAAIVISRHANLRTADNASATVIRTVPQDATVEVIKQQGAWFLVKTETEQGWMHGNTLKLQNFQIASSAPNTSSNASPPFDSSTVPDLKIKGNRNSMIYHLPNCQNYADISARNAVWFKSEEEAQRAGYRMAKNCSGSSSTPSSSQQTPAKVYAPASPPQFDASSPGATARCRDGSLSYSASRRGTCSHHGGVAQWY